ncbi:MAG: O-antigen polymerase [Syntrophomonadaceae bacterium]
MTILFLTSFALLFIILSKYLFGKWFNHLALYTAVWYFVITLYEVRLMNYVEIKSTAWLVIAGSFVSFFLGSVTVYFARNSLRPASGTVPDSNRHLKLFSDGGKFVRNVIIVCFVIGLFAAIQHWMVLIKMFGSIGAVLVKTNLVYRMRVDGELEGVIPYVWVVAYVGVFFSGIYTAFKNKMTFVAFLPFIAVILKEISNASRAGMLVAFFMFISAFFLYRHIAPNKISFSRRAKLLLASAVLIGLIILSAGMVRTLRGSTESYSANSKELNQFKSGFFITPSLYLYLSSHVGVLSEYLEKDFDYRAKLFGETTFQPVYNFLSKFGMVEHPKFYEKGYFIPMWTNTATYLRLLHSDFGISGIYVVPYLVGLLASFYWYRLLEKKKTLDLVLLSFLYVVIMFSSITIVTRLASWFISLAILIIVIPFMEKTIEKKRAGLPLVN